MFDYVIVGGGSAGCVLANRLTADPRTAVLLLEAGSADTRREIAVPAAFSTLFKSPVDWAYYTEPQPELDGRRLYWPRGKVLGGSSAINAMIYHRGHPADFDAWRDAGNEGWGYADVLPYFRRAENQERGASEYHGAGGPLDVCDPRSVNPLTLAFLRAAQACGLPRNPDFNGAEQLGVGVFQLTQRRGRRWSAADAYLTPARARPNLTVRTGAHVTRILFDGRRASGVAFVEDGVPQQAGARREVLLCGGSINSPQLLAQSGVGPGAELAALGIPLVHDLPGVERNLQDHLACGAMYSSRRPISMAGAGSLRHIVSYLLFRRGPLTSNVAEAGGFFRSGPDRATPDLEILFAPSYYLEHGFANPSGHGYTVGVVLLKPESRGTVTLRSTDPFQPPVVDPRYLSAASDAPRLVQALRFARRVGRDAAFDPYRGSEIVPGASDDDDAALLALIRRSSETLYHPVGTCRMGRDLLAVVDAALRVRGLESLRVVDASVMPTIVSGHTHAATVMIAERAADLIRGRSAVDVRGPREHEKQRR